MKTKKRYEVTYDNESVQLVDVTDYGKGEGFENLAELRAALILGIQDKPKDVQKRILGNLDDIVRRMSKEGELRSDDILDSSHRVWTPQILTTLSKKN